MNATERAGAGSAPATLCATVDLPLPDPPAMPMMRGLDTSQNVVRSGGFDIEKEATTKNTKHTKNCFLKGNSSRGYALARQGVSNQRKNGRAIEAGWCEVAFVYFVRFVVASFSILNFSIAVRRNFF